MRPTAPQQWAPTPGRQETNQATPYQQQVYPPDVPPQSRAPPLVPVRVTRSQPGKAKMPGVGPHPEGLKADTRETDPPPEDPGNAGEAPIVTT